MKKVLALVLAIMCAASGCQKKNDSRRPGAGPAIPAAEETLDSKIIVPEVRPEALDAVPGLPAPGENPIDPVRTGLAYWATPPALVSPYDGTYFDFQILLWHSPPGKDTETSLFFDRIRQMNLTGGMAYSTYDSKTFAEEGMPYYRTNICNLLYIRNKSYKAKQTDLKKNRTRKVLQREPSLEDPAMLKGELERCRRIAAMDKGKQVLSYDLRDEASYTTAANAFEFDFSEISLKGFRVWIKTQYTDLAALNRQWETDFASWDAVMPFTIEEIRTREWKQKKTMAAVNLAPCVDHRAYNDYIWFETLKAYKREIHTIDPEAPVGYSGTQMPSAWGGFNFDLYGRYLTWCEYYDITGSREVMRGLFQEDTPLLSVLGYGNTETAALRMWSNILHGDPGALVWPFSGNDLVKGSLLMDMKSEGWPITEKGRNLAVNAKQARGGIVPLLRKARFLNDGIAILYHQPSLRADWFFEVKRDGSSYVNRFSSWESGHNYMAAQRVSIHKLTEDLGYQYTYARSRDLVDNRLLANGIKVLILSRNVCLSDEEIAALKVYAENGGTIVSDLMVGRLDNHGTARPTEDLTDINSLLGVTRSEFLWQEDTKAERDKGYAGGYGYPVKLAFNENFGTIKAGDTHQVQGFQEKGLAPSAGSTAHAAAGLASALIVNKVGKGSVITLNFDFPNYSELRNDPEGLARTGTCRSIWRHILSGIGGISPVFEVTNKDGQYPRGVETIHYADGGNHYLALVNNREVLIDWASLEDKAADSQAVYAARTVKVKIPTHMRVFDVLNRKELGLTDTFEGDLKPYTPLIFALRPYEVKELTAESDGEPGPQKQLAVRLEIKTEGKSDIGNHAVHTILMDQKGNVIPEGTMNIPLPGGSFQGKIDLSYVKTEGPYTLKLTDVSSGAEAELKIK